MDEEGKFSPPYNVPWATFISTAERIAEDPPTRVDRSYLGSQSGNTQTYLIAAFKGFGLISENESRPTGILDWKDPDKRKAHVADLLRTYYGSMVELGKTNSTPAELAEKFGESFPQITGESRTKATRFFLAAMAYADLQVAPLWAKVKAPRGASGRKTGSRRPKGGNGAGEGSTTSQPRTGEHRSVTLGSGATLTLDCSVPLLTLPATELTSVLTLIKTFDGLATKGGKARQTSAPSQPSDGAADPAITESPTSTPS